MGFFGLIEVVVLVALLPSYATGQTCDSTYFVLYRGQLIYGATQQSGISTWQACVTGCTLTGTACYAADFNTGDNSCWYHFSAQTGTPHSYSIVNHFRRSCNNLPACTATFWNVYPDTAITGGTLVSTSMTLDQCVANCEATTNCVGMNFVGTSCYRFITGVPALTAGNSAGSFHLKRCNAPTVTAPTSSASCDQTYFAFYQNALSSGASQQSGITTWDACTAACNTYAPECYAVDFDTRSNSCWHHTTSALTSTPGSLAGVNHYRRVCNGNPTCSAAFWQLYDNLEVSGGILTLTTATRDTCITACQGISTCVAMTLVGTNCYVFNTNVPAISTGTANNDALHLRRCNAPTGTSTASPCDATSFAYYENSNQPGGTKQTAYTTWGTCIAACTLTSCYAVDFDSRDNSCWFVTAQPTNGPFTLASVYHHRRICTTNTPTCTASSPYWRVYPDTEQTGGLLTMTGLSRTQCLALCNAVPSCVAVNLDGTNCYLFHTGVAAATAGNKAGVYHFRKCNANALTYPTVTSGCDQTFFALFRTSRSSNGLQRYGANTLATCLLHCDSIAPECYGADFNSNDNTCFLHSAQITQTVTTSGVNQYRRECNSVPACNAATPHWRYYPNSEVTGGTLTSSSSTQDQCITACEGTTGCVAMNFVGTSCYQFTTTPAAVTAGNKAGTVHIRRCNV